jgi:hypothetical protein
MSKIFHALKLDQFFRAKRQNKDPKLIGTSFLNHKDRRMTARIHVDVPLFVYGYTPGGTTFYEETHTIEINGGGGLVSMTSRVQPGQRLAVTNEGNEQTQECVVVSVRAQLAHGNHIALKFPTPMPQFWQALEIGKDRAP